MKLRSFFSIPTKKEIDSAKSIALIIMLLSANITLVAAVVFSGRFAMPLCFAEEVVLSYQGDIKQLSFQNIGDKGKEENFSFQARVILGARFLWSTQDGGTHLYDFEKRKYYSLNHEKKDRFETSLFAFPAFNTIEFYNTKSLTKALYAGGADIDMEQFDYEALFHIEEKGIERPKIERLREDLVVRFKVAGNLVSEFELSEDRFPKAVIDTFRKYLLYEHKIHPKIVRDVASLGVIPKTITYFFKEPGFRGEVKLALEKVEIRSNQGYLIPKEYQTFKEDPVENHRAVSQIIDEVLAGKVRTLQKDKDWFVSNAEASLNQGRYLESFLFLTEYHLQTGDREGLPLGMMDILLHQAKEDPELRLFLVGTNVSGVPSARKAEEALSSINRNGIQRAHVIDILLANAKAVLGKKEEGIDLMISALKANPYNASAYHDLGQMFYQDYETLMAWKCWDAARSLYPQHWLLQSVGELERQLLKNHPEFF